MPVTFEDEQQKLDGIFGDEDVRARVGFTADYAAPVNYGGEPHWPPLTPMLKWTDRMGWQNYGLDSSMSEGEMWDYVDERRNERKPLPAAFLLASHIADEGTEAMMYASDAFAEAQTTAESWAAKNVSETDSLEKTVKRFANYSLGLAEDNLLRRVSSASTGTLLKSMQPAELV